MKPRIHLAVYVLLFIALAVAFAEPISRVLVYTYEDISFALYPSAQYAFEIGNAHFRASDPRAYDIERAKRFYYKALALDLEHPMVWQQLARTSFVQGDTPAAFAQINMQLMKHPDSNVSAYYIRALILGYQKKYADAALDYQRVIEMDPTRWPAYNDLAWTLLLDKRYQAALDTSVQGLSLVPDNPWLLTMNAVALYELGRYHEAYDSIERAVSFSKVVTTADWVAMYPGNDPASIPAGLKALRDSAEENRIKIEEKLNAASTTRTRGTI